MVYVLEQKQFHVTWNALENVKVEMILHTWGH